MASLPEFRKIFRHLDNKNIVAQNLISFLPESSAGSQQQTTQAFSDKWAQYRYGTQEFEKLVKQQKEWYFDLYGFCGEKELAQYLKDCPLVLDAGAGMCFKAAWFAELSPSSLIVAADISGDTGRLFTMGPSMEAVPTKDTVMEPVEIVRIEATIKGSMIPRTG